MPAAMASEGMTMPWGSRDLEGEHERYRPGHFSKMAISRVARQFPIERYPGPPQFYYVMV